MVPPEVATEAVLRHTVAVIAAALSPSAVVVIPRTGARLGETTVHLPFVLWDAAGVDAPIGSLAVCLDASVIGAAVALLRSSLTLRWSVDLMRLLSGLLMLLLMLCGLRLLMLLSLLRFLLPRTLLLVLCVGWGSGSKQQEQNGCADNASSFHLSALLLTASSPLTLSGNLLFEI